MTMHTYMVMIFFLMIGGFAGILLLEILSKTFDLYSILKGDWDLALKPKASTYDTKLLLGKQSQRNQSYKNKQPSFPHDSDRFQGSPFHILGLKEKPKPTLTQIKLAYRKMIGIYHPDLYAKYDQKTQEEVTRRAQIINSSYHKLRDLY